jgi:hypothetical protein
MANTIRKKRAARRGKTATTQGFRWSRSSDEQLLSLRMSDLGVRLETSWVNDIVNELYHELDRRKVAVKPHVWISHDWFSPEGVPGIAVPFYLVHPRLIRLERSQMLEAEGASRDECLRIMRHECGHAIQDAYQLHRRRAWQKMFGSATRRYPEYYRPNPSSRKFVQHLRLYYAQSHPVEDFAETFAVWLQPRAMWRKRYAGWPALKKLEYVDALMAELQDTRPVLRSRRTVDPVHRLRTTLREYYDDKRERYATTHPDIYDRDLRRLFSDDPKHVRRELASRFLRRNRVEIRRLVSRWTGEYQFTLDMVLSDMIGRCRELRLRVVGDEREARIEFAVLLTVKTMHFLYSNRNWIAL